MAAMQLVAGDYRLLSAADVGDAAECARFWDAFWTRHAAGARVADWLPGDGPAASVVALPDGDGLSYQLFEDAIASGALLRTGLQAFQRL